MKKRIFSILKFLLFLSLGLFLAWLSVKDFTEEEVDQFFASVKAADYKWIILSMALGLISHWSRAVRWVMLLEPVGHKPGKANTFYAVMVGYLANFAFPRIGEITRCGVLARYENIPFPVAFGTVIAERTIDLLCLLIIFFATLFSQFDGLYGLASEHIITPAGNLFQKIAGNTYLLWGGIGLLGLMLLTLILFRKKIKSIFSGKIAGMLKGFWEGLLSIRRLRSPSMFIFHTVLIWTLYYVMLHVCFYSFEETSGLGVGQGMAVLIMGAVGIMFTQGGLGAYHFLVTVTLTSALAGISEPVAGAFAWVVWSSQFITLLLTGLISLILLPINNKNKV